MRKCYWLLSFLLLVSHVFSQSNLLNGQPTPVSMPDPMQLSSSWWDYFEGSQEEFAGNKKLFLKSLRSKLKALSPDKQKAAQELLGKIAKGLEIIQRTHGDVQLIVAEKTEYLSQYNLKNLEEFASQKYELQKDIKQIEKHMEIENSYVSQKEQVLDSKWLAYKEIKENTEAKLMKGLNVIEKKIYLFIDKQKLKELQFAKKQKQLFLENINQKIAYARAHLVLEKQPDSSNVEELLSRELKNLDALRMKLFVENLKPQDVHLIKQKFLNSSVLNLIYTTDFLKEKIVQAFFTSANTKNSQIHTEIKTWYEELGFIERNLHLWEEKSQFYYQTALQDIETSHKEFYQKSSELAEKSILLIHQLKKNIFVVRFLLGQFEIYVKEKHMSFFNRIGLYWHGIANFFAEHGYWFKKGLFKIGEHPITPLALIKFLIIIFSSYFLAKWVRSSLRRSSRRYRHISQAGLYTLSRLIYYVIILSGMLIAILFIGVDLTAFAVILGALSIGIGFSLQPFASNIVAGIIVLLEKNVRVGDFVELASGDLGTIKEINLRTTLITTLDNLEILMPNVDLISKKFINWTLSEKIRRARIPFGVAFGSDKEKVRRVVVDAAKKVPTTIDKIEPDVWLREIGEFALNFELVVWVNEYTEGLKPCFTSSRYLWAIESALQANNIKIPFPVRDVRLNTEK